MDLCWFSISGRARAIGWTTRGPTTPSCGGRRAGAIGWTTRGPTTPSRGGRRARAIGWTTCGPATPSCGGRRAREIGWTTVVVDTTPMRRTGVRAVRAGSPAIRSALPAADRRATGPSAIRSNGHPPEMGT